MNMGYCIICYEPIKRKYPPLCDKHLSEHHSKYYENMTLDQYKALGGRIDDESAYRIFMVNKRSEAKGFGDIKQANK